MYIYLNISTKQRERSRCCSLPTRYFTTFCCDSDRLDLELDLTLSSHPTEGVRRNA